MATYDYPRPALTADTAVFRAEAGGVEILLVRRGQPPFEGLWALPGGFVEEDEPPAEAAARELREETGLAPVEPGALVGVYGDPGRDPRGWTVTVLYGVVLGGAAPRPRAGDDAAEVAWHMEDALPGLAFDHAILVADAFAWARARAAPRAGS